MKQPQAPPDVSDVLWMLHEPAKVHRALEVQSPTIGQRYAHWDKLRFLEPPAGLNHLEWWALTKNSRRLLQKELPLRGANSRQFLLGTPDPLYALTSELDRKLSSSREIPAELQNDALRDTYAMSAQIEEAIRSSQLEGASTTRQVGAEMLRTGRAPRNDSERMIRNNFQAMEYVREVADRPLTPELVCELHRRVTLDTLEESQAGHLRTSDDIVVRDQGGEIVHRPPPASELPQRLTALCHFANGKTPAHYVHPLARAAVLHLMLGYDHPFADGNGRTARALFYWSALRSGYWMVAFTSISKLLREAPARYVRAYLYTETDELDATYFVLFQLGILDRAVDELREYLAAKVSEIASARALLRESRRFNHRQLALLSHALAHPGASYGATGHGRSHQVTRQTARTDLKELASLGLLDTAAAGKAVVYLAPKDLRVRLEAFDGRGADEAS